MILGHKGAVIPGNCFSFNLSRNFVEPLRDKLRATLPSVTPLRNAKNSLQRCEDLCGTGVKDLRVGVRVGVRVRVRVGVGVRVRVRVTVPSKRVKIYNR